MALPEENLKEIRWAVSELAKRQKAHRLYLAYYQGAHRLMIDKRRLETIFGRLFSDFRMNICSAVVDALADRLQVQSFSSGGASDENRAAEDAGEIWKRNRMRRRSKQLHRTSISAGDAYAIVWPDPTGYPIVYPNSPLEVCVQYDPQSPGTIVRAAKLWKVEDGTHRLTLYYPDRIEKYQTLQKNLVSTEVNSTPDGPVSGGALGGSALSANRFVRRVIEGEKWPLVNQYEQVPVFHFANNSDLGEMGVSELRDAVPVQDGLNKSVFDMLVGGEFQSYPQRWALNIEVVKDDSGNVVSPFKAGPERVWVLNGGENTQMGQFNAADLAKMLEVKKGWSLDMAQVTQTPPHFFMLPSGLVSGESQKTAEQKLDSKVGDRTESFGDTWGALMALAVRMYRGMQMDGLELDTNWKDTKPRNHKEEWEIAGMKAERGVSDEQLLREQGYTDDQINQFKRERGQEPLLPAETTT
jgi:hypothetical protein